MGCSSNSAQREIYKQNLYFKKIKYQINLTFIFKKFKRHQPKHKTKRTKKIIKTRK